MPYPEGASASSKNAIRWSMMALKRSIFMHTWLYGHLVLLPGCQHEPQGRNWATGLNGAWSRRCERRKGRSAANIGDNPLKYKVYSIGQMEGQECCEHR